MGFSWVAPFVILALAASPTPLTPKQILARMAQNTAGLQTFEVPVTIHARLKKGISIPVTMSGERYFKVPDKGALKLRGVPEIAKTFSSLYSSLGTPSTWPHTYNIRLVSVSIESGRPVYELSGTYKHPSSVDHVTLDVDGETFVPLEAHWFYTNGATIAMSITEGIVGGKYRLPLSESVDVHFPEYSGDASIEYGAYQLNVALPNSLFGP